MKKINKQSLIACLIILSSCQRTDYQEEDIIKTEWDSEKGKVVKNSQKKATWTINKKKKESDLFLKL